MQLRNKKLKIESDSTQESSSEQSLNRNSTQVTRKKSTIYTKKLKKERSKVCTPIKQASKATFKIENNLFDDEWKAYLKDQFDSEYFLTLNRTLENEYNQEKIRPEKELVFNAFNLTSLGNVIYTKYLNIYLLIFIILLKFQVRCVILGQDPYHDEGQAHGLAFSVPKTLDIPRSLMNIFKELSTDITGFERDEKNGGCLENWSKEGVFLLNVFLTVRQYNKL